LLFFFINFKEAKKERVKKKDFVFCRISSYTAEFYFIRKSTQAKEREAYLLYI
jgi:hypothetical protein